MTQRREWRRGLLPGRCFGLPLKTFPHICPCFRTRLAPALSGADAARPRQSATPLGLPNFTPHELPSVRRPRGGRGGGEALAGCLGGVQPSPRMTAPPASLTRPGRIIPAAAGVRRAATQVSMWIRLLPVWDDLRTHTPGSVNYAKLGEKTTCGAADLGLLLLRFIGAKPSPVR